MPGLVGTLNLKIRVSRLLKVATSLLVQRRSERRGSYQSIMSGLGL